MVELSAVNRLVTGSNPVARARQKTFTSVDVFCYNDIMKNKNVIWWIIDFICLWDIYHTYFILRDHELTIIFVSALLFTLQYQFFGHSDYYKGMFHTRKVGEKYNLPGLAIGLLRILFTIGAVLYFATSIIK